ncbi:MAG TPA: endonuclease/exonuclease/phosphatase family protein, partial [Acidimicrobiales bacterium]|nr:endonuclease/exonuclease/phosphatase family protein [Acidimicrobiales bacterium]
MAVSPHYGELIETTVRVASWNLWWRFGPWESRAPAILETLRRVDADVVCLQEVWGEGGETFAARLGDALGMHHAYSSRLEIDGVDFGNAVLSRWPITATEWWPLPAPVELDEHRTVLVADVDGPRGPLQVWCTHLNWRFDHSAIRQEQVRFIASKVADRRPRSYPPILCGDMNAAPDSDEI